MEVLKKELKQMIDKQVWIPVKDNYMTSDERGQVIRCSVFLKEKFHADGSFDKLKARLADGTVIVKFMKALYGCVQSAKLWYNHLKTILESLQFCANT